MTPQIFLKTIVDPTLNWLVQIGAGVAPTDEARVLVLAIAGQESGWSDRRQAGGPARGYWQFEQGGGVAEVMQKAPSQLGRLCGLLDIPFERGTLFEAMAWNDTLACAMARYLLWQDPAKLPALDESGQAWSYYQRNWRPGAPRPDAWPAVYTKALLLVKVIP